MTMRPAVVYGKNYVGNVIDDFFKEAFGTASRVCEAPIRTDIKETDEGYEIEMDLPGFATEDMKAELKDGYLIVSAEHTEEKEENDEEKHYIRRERYSGSYRRKFYVGDAVTQDDIKAKYSDGVLTVSVPKIEKKDEEEDKKYIPIEE